MPWGLELQRNPRFRQLPMHDTKRNSIGSPPGSGYLEAKICHTSSE
jgi:hypothetical protein